MSEKQISRIDKIIRNKIYQSFYYKEKCFGLNASTVIDRAVELKSIGGTYGGSRKPTAFLCLLLKLLQISPELEIIQKYLESDYKYLRILAAFYIRLVDSPIDVYRKLEPLLVDYSRVKLRQSDSTISLACTDEVIDNLLHKEIYMDIALPHIPKRFMLEEQEGLPLRVSPLDAELDFEEAEESAPEKPVKKKKVQQPKEPVPDSLEYWNKLRLEAGLPPLKPNK